MATKQKAKDKPPTDGERIAAAIHAVFETDDGIGGIANVADCLNALAKALERIADGQTAATPLAYAVGRIADALKVSPPSVPFLDAMERIASAYGREPEPAAAPAPAAPAPAPEPAPATPEAPAELVTTTIGAPVDISTP